MLFQFTAHESSITRIILDLHALSKKSLVNWNEVEVHI